RGTCRSRHRRLTRVPHVFARRPRRRFDHSYQRGVAAQWLPALAVRLLRVRLRPRVLAGLSPGRLSAHAARLLPTPPQVRQVIEDRVITTTPDGFSVAAPARPHHDRGNGGHVVVTPPGDHAYLPEMPA